MAEVLGAVASGIALAEIALKLKSLLGEINDAPETLESLVNQVDVYAGMLNGLNFDDVLESDIPRSLHASLRAAALQCQNAVNQLSLVVRDLSALGKTSFRRRKMVAIRFVLQKDSTAQFERQLQTAVQCLALAHQLYVFAWQKTQLPDMIVARLLSQHMSLPPKASITIRGSVSAPVMNAWSEPASAQADKSIPNYVWRNHKAALLPAKDDGEMLYFDPDNERKEDTAWVDPSQSPGRIRPHHKANAFQRRLRLPAWSSFYVFEIFAQYSYTGWKASLAIYNVYPEDSSQYDDAYYLLRTNDDREIYRALECREFSIHDRFLRKGSELSLTELALLNSSWRSCNYLLDLNPRPLTCTSWGYINENEDGEENLRQLEILLKRDEVPDEFRVPEFTNFIGDGASFNRFRRQIWTDEEFYCNSFLITRNLIAWNLAAYSDSYPSTYRFFRNVLSPTGSLQSQDIYTGCLLNSSVGQTDILLHGLAIATSAIPWRILTDRNNKQSLAYLKDTSRNSKPYVERAMLDGWALVASEIVPLWTNLHELLPGNFDFGGKSAFYWSFFNCFSKLRFSSTDINFRNQSRSMRFLLIEPSLKLWLNILRNTGIDLKEYGEKEAELFIGEQFSERPFLMEEVTYGDRLSRIHGGDDLGENLEVNLISFQYGAEVDDWKLWWSEPSDVFAGDFWKLIESPYQPVPGAWVED